MMQSYTLKIEALSPLHLGMGKADVIIDSETAHDEYGMPYFPAKRLKGMLYESAFEMAEISSEEWFTFTDIKKLFGQAEDGIPRFKIDNLYFPDYHAKRDGWDYLFNKYEGLFNKNHVLQNYTEVRYQTMIDDETGTASDGSLRNMRLVDAGTVFIGELILADYNDINRKILEYACKNLRYVGAKRNRGCGHVRCELLKGGKA